LSSLNSIRVASVSIDHIMTTSSFDRGRGGMPGSAAPQPVVIGRARLAGELAIPDGATTLALFVHPTTAGRQHAGHLFMGDVLRANGVATLSIGLRTADEEVCRAPLPGAAEVTQRLQAVVDCLAAHAATRHLQPALVGVNEAAAPCAIAARQPGLEAFRSVVLLDGRVDLRDAEVAAWRQPTLCIAGRHGIALSGQPLAGARSLPPPHRLVKLRVQTQPLASAGAFQTMACQIAAWLRRRDTVRHESMPADAMELESTQ
jgi:hypothetical protein